MNDKLERYYDEIAAHIDENADRIFITLSDLYPRFLRRLPESVVGWLEVDDARMLQVALRYAAVLQSDREEHTVEMLNDPRSLAVLVLEWMRASPIFAKMPEEASDEEYLILSSINCEFCVYVIHVWLEIDDICEITSKPARDFLRDALQFRGGCRHTLAIVFQMLADNWARKKSSDAS